MSITIKTDNADSREHIISRNGSKTGRYSLDILDAGTEYIISAYALIDSLKSENATIISTYTSKFNQNAI